MTSGERACDEVNRIQAGKNYGWFIVTKGQHYNAARDTRQGPDGFVYLLTDETFGTVLKLEPGQ